MAQLVQTASGSPEGRADVVSWKISDLRILLRILPIDYFYDARI
jgi:hypothetical protein